MELSGRATASDAADNLRTHKSRGPGSSRRRAAVVRLMAAAGVAGIVVSGWVIGFGLPVILVAVVFFLIAFRLFRSIGSSVTKTGNERLPAKEVLRTSGDLYQIIVETAQEGMWVLDSEARTTYVNRRVEEMLGYTRDELLGRVPFEFLDLESVPTAEALWRNRDERLREQQDLCFLRKDGSKLWAILKTSAVLDEEKRVVYGLGMITDITRRKRAEDLNQALNVVNAAITSTLEFDKIMQRVVVESTRAIGCDLGAVLLREGEDWVVAYHYGFPMGVSGTRISEKDSYAASVAIKTRTPVAIGDCYTDERANREISKAYGIRAELVIPLIVRDEAIGILFLGYSSEPLRFKDIEIDFAGKLGACVALALENSRLYESERRARSAIQTHFELLQQALVPHITHTDSGFEMGTAYVPAYGELEIGGDFFDIFGCEGTKLCVMIGDVSGKGTEAAAIAAGARNTVRAFACELTSTSDVMSRTNSVLYGRRSEYESFVTILFAVLDGATGELRYTSAGHPPALVYRSNGSMEVLDAHQAPIGPFETQRFEETVCRLDRGDKILFYTDGISEARCGAGLFELEGIERTLKQYGHLPPQEIVDNLLRAARDWARGMIRDDVAVVVVERK